MDVILLTTAATQLSLYLLDSYSRRKPSTTHLPPSPPSAPISPPPSQHPPEEPEPGSIAQLEKKLDDLRAQAKKLTSPDDFVSYARVTRQATKVEIELAERKKAEPQDVLAGLNPTKLLQAMLPATAQRSIKRNIGFAAFKLLLRVIAFLFLYIYFSRPPYHSTVMTLPCRLVRPLTFLFRPVPPHCDLDDWQCATQPTECAVPFHIASMLAQTAAGAVRDML